MTPHDPRSARTALAPLEPILQDGSVSEIMIDGPDRVLVERKGRIEDTSVKFASAEALRAAIDAALALGGEAFAPGQTVCDARLSDGSRILAVLPPTAPDGPYLVLRKFFTRGMTWERLFEYNSVSREMYDLLNSAIRARRNMLVAGGTGSGKTTVLNLLAESVPAEERVIVVGDRGELPVNHPRRIHLEPNRRAGLSQTDLLLTAAKMRPDRLVCTEFMGAEAIHALQLANTGHDGSLFTIHANSAEDALARLEAMCLMADLGLGLGEIRAMIASAVHVITCQQRLPDGSRKLTQVTEVLGLENDRYVLQPLMRYNPETGQFERTLAKPSWEQK
jgi:pilus assembly protein CpaF